MFKATLRTAAPVMALAAAATLGALPATSHADLAFNVGAVSDYRYRGISQTRLKPAVQGGVDWSHESGFYVGGWASSIKWVKDAYGDSQVEIDLYGGFKNKLTDDLSYDVGVLQYIYPGAKTRRWNAIYKDPNTTEIYGAVSFGPLTAKVSYAATNLFGNYDFGANRDSKGSLYFDLSGAFDLGDGLLLTPHVGYQKVRRIANASYTDYSFTLSKDFSGLVPSIGIVGTDADKSFYVPGGAANSSKFLGKTAVVLAVKYNF